MRVGCAGPTGRVLAFEPMAEVYAALALNIAANDLSGFVIPVHAALGRNVSHVSTPVLHLSLDRVTNSGQTSLRDIRGRTPDTHPTPDTLPTPDTHGATDQQPSVGANRVPSPHAGFDSRRRVMPLDAFDLPQLALIKIGVGVMFPVCMCVRVRMRERERECMCVCVCVCV